METFLRHSALRYFKLLNFFIILVIMNTAFDYLFHTLQAWCPDIIAMAVTQRVTLKRFVDCVNLILRLTNTGRKHTLWYTLMLWGGRRRRKGRHIGLYVLAVGIGHFTDWSLHAFLASMDTPSPDATFPKSKHGWHHMGRWQKETYITVTIPVCDLLVVLKSALRHH